MLDSTDVNMWYKIGQVALRLVRVPLARHAFEEGLNCNPDHWPCLDNLITVLYTLCDYTCASSAPASLHRNCGVTLLLSLQGACTSSPKRWSTITATPKAWC